VRPAQAVDGLRSQVIDRKRLLERRLARRVGTMDDDVRPFKGGVVDVGWKIAPVRFDPRFLKGIRLRVAHQRPHFRALAPEVIAQMPAQKPAGAGHTDALDSSQHGSFKIWHKCLPIRFALAIMVKVRPLAGRYGKTDPSAR